MFCILQNQNVADNATMNKKEIKKEVGTSAGLSGVDIQSKVKVVVPTPDLPRIEGTDAIDTIDAMESKNTREVKDGNIPTPKGSVKYWKMELGKLVAKLWRKNNDRKNNKN